MKKIVILGGGYAGLSAMRSLSSQVPGRGYSLELIDASPWHTVKTRFHEMLVTRRKDRLIRHPIERFTRAAAARFLQADIQGMTYGKRSVKTTRGEVEYDRLLMTLGGQTNYFGVRGARRHTVSLQTWEGARACRERVEKLEMNPRKGPCRRVIVCGGGIEGLEVASMLRQHARPSRCEILMVERAEKIMARSQCGEGQRKYAERFFSRRAVSVMTGTAIREVRPEGVILDSGERIECDLVFWCSGVRRTELKGTGRGKPFLVNRFLQSPRHPEVFATGDFATVEDAGEGDNLFSAQRAMYQAGLMAENLLRSDRGEPMKPMDYRPAGELIALGDMDGVGVVGGLPVRGRTAALMKKANEAKYLAELYRDVPGSLIRNAIP